MATRIAQMLRKGISVRFAARGDNQQLKPTEETTPHNGVLQKENAAVTPPAKPLRMGFRARGRKRALRRYHECHAPQLLAA